MKTYGSLDLILRFKRTATSALFAGGLLVGEANAQVVRYDLNITPNTGRGTNTNVDEVTDIDLNQDGSADLGFRVESYFDTPPLEIFWSLDGPKTGVNAGPVDLYTQDGLRFLEAGDVVGATPSSGIAIDTVGGANNDTLELANASTDIDFEPTALDSYKSGLFSEDDNFFGAVGIAVSDGVGGTNYGAVYFSATNTFDGTVEGVLNNEVTAHFAEFETSGGDYTVVSPLKGDFNNDGAVDAADYTVWRDNLGAPAGVLANDITREAIGLTQYNDWRANFGATAPTFGSLSASGSLTDAAAVPEPRSLLSLAAAASLCLLRRLR